MSNAGTPPPRMFSPSQIAENYLNIGVNKVRQNPLSAFLLAIMAGMMIALAGAAATVGSATLENPSAAKLASAAIFPAGLVMVLVGGSELFTGNCMLVITLGKKRITLGEMMKSWAIVYAGNLTGALLVAALFVYSHTPSLFGGKLAAVVTATAAAKCALSFGDALMKGILCNLLVCLGVWLSFAATDVVGKIAGCYLPIFAFVVAGYEHCIANMYYIPAGIFTAGEYGLSAPGLDFAAMTVNNLIPVTIGNIIGGSLLVGGLYGLAYLRK